MTETLKDKIGQMERTAILSALEECDWVQAEAARRLGITERMIGYKIKKYGIRKGANEESRVMSQETGCRGGVIPPHQE